jgi:hypothetical protein
MDPIVTEGRPDATATVPGVPARSKVPHPSQEELWPLVDELIRAFERAAEFAPVMRQRYEIAMAVEDHGGSWASVLGPHNAPQLIEATNDLIDDLMRLGAELRRVLARGLYAEGLSMEEIANMYGVSRQRVSAIISSTTDPAKGPWRTRTNTRDRS